MPVTKSNDHQGPPPPDAHEKREAEYETHETRLAVEHDATKEQAKRAPV